MNRRLLGYFFALFLPTAIIVVAGGIIVHRTQAIHDFDRIEARAESALAAGAANLNSSVDSISRDVLQLAGGSALRAAIEAGSPESIAALTQDFASVARVKPEYEKVRWIDANGIERVVVYRTSGRVVTTAIDPTDPQHDKSGRYYFKPASQLPAGRIYVSPLDFDVEGGAIAVPANPTVRVATPVFDSGGARRGIVVISSRAQSLISRWHTATATADGIDVLLNEEGYWLHGAKPSDEWGFMFGRKETFGTRHPDVWSRIRDAEAANWLTQEGLWVSRTIHPWSESSDYRWISVSLIPAATLAANSRFERMAISAAVAALLLTALVFSWTAARYWMKREDSLLAAAHHETEEVQASLASILDNSPEATLIVNAEGVVTQANASAGRAFACEAATLVGLGVEELVQPGARERHTEHRAMFAGNRRPRALSAAGDINPMRRDGTTFPAELALTPLHIHGQPYVMVTILDITERKRAESEIRALNENLERRVGERTAALAAAEANLRMLLESSADGLYGVDTSGRITFMNPAARRMLGYDESQAIGMDADALVATGGGSDAVTRPVQATLSSGRPVSADDQCYRHADGHEVPVMYATRLLEQADQVVGAVVSFVDVTQRRALDAARDASLNEAERLNRARSSFLSNMSHEIRTPLNGILGLAQVGFREAYQRVSAQETFARIMESGRLLQSIIDDVLDFARVDAGKLSIESVPVYLGRLVDEAMAPVMPAAKAKGLELRATRASDVPATCMSDPLRLKQVLMNLLSNAVKFTDHGSVTLSVTRQANQLVFAVADTGIGISVEQQCRIFTAFEQADSSTTRRFGGTGLGLSIAQRITELMGGEISVESRPDHGSTFEVRLPLVEPEVPVEEEDPNSMLKTQRVRRLEGLRVLVAEDNEVNQMVMQAMLEPEGPKLAFASDGEQVLQRIKEDGADAYDIVLMDLQMPVMDGYEATNRIREIDPNLPIVAQTAHVLADTIEQCRAAGMVAHISKPVDRHQLIDTILRYARHR